MVCCMYKKVSSSTSVGFSNSDWASDADDPKSTSGHIFKLVVQQKAGEVRSSHV